MKFFVVVALVLAACRTDTAFSVMPDAANDSGRADVLIDAPSSVADASVTDAAPPADLCVATGGKIEMQLCCKSTAAFPNNCLVGACGCAPEFGHPVQACSCPMNSCFLPERGCVIQACEPGRDQTCNDSLSVSAIYGRCEIDRTCTCMPGRTVNPTTGKCR